jgi:hypothetical protein
MVIVLHISQLLVEQTDVVIVNQGDGTDHARFRRLPGLFHELVPDQIAEGLRPVRVASLVDELVEFFEELGIYGYANSTEIAHG